MLLAKLQDDLPEFAGNETTRLRYQKAWLTEHKLDIAILISQKGLEQAADFLGMSQIVLMPYRKLRFQCVVCKELYPDFEDSVACVRKHEVVK